MSGDRLPLEQFDYSLRTNKNIERKIVFETLLELIPVLPLSTYRYMGFGS